MKAGDFYRLEIDDTEVFNIYSTTSSGVMLLNKQILCNQQHNQVIFHQSKPDVLLCEIKPFISNDNIRQYAINGASLKIVENYGSLCLYFKGKYYGCINQKCNSIQFEKIEKHNRQYGLLYILGDKKHIILFDDIQIIFCLQYIDSEVLKDCIQIYEHYPNIFNVGRIVKYDFESRQLTIKSVNDAGVEHKQINSNFTIIYFLEAIKCGRYKYAYNNLSYELKAEINIETLSKYFCCFDEYRYLHEQDLYVTLKNHRIVGMYHFDINKNLIDNIY
ncbi:MAG: hypothetical protein IJ458_01685 [Clostridia bacterium]|nr:hypothetical protein [Clostridia bacterium]